ncbi:hypothetical protein NDU88_006849 [Pleurodeles waltl]|uniref:Uncharacterized protein n=1 Tax=Pleurodeles waltl TaxID=8319 RepID=A0AAV7WBT5_PLEWA|nr:hypothetical protein NDU88_006849 [Pleurodeles waltl]
MLQCLKRSHTDAAMPQAEPHRCCNASSGATQMLAMPQVNPRGYCSASRRATRILQRLKQSHADTAAPQAEPRGYCSASSRATRILQRLKQSHADTAAPQAEPRGYCSASSRATRILQRLKQSHADTAAPQAEPRGYCSASSRATRILQRLKQSHADTAAPQAEPRRYCSTSHTATDTAMPHLSRVATTQEKIRAPLMHNILMLPTQATLQLNSDLMMHSSALWRLVRGTKRNKNIHTIVCWVASVGLRSDLEETPTYSNEIALDMVSIVKQ